MEVMTRSALLRCRESPKNGRRWCFLLISQQTTRVLSYVYLCKLAIGEGWKNLSVRPKDIKGHTFTTLAFPQSIGIQFLSIPTGVGGVESLVET